MVLLFVSETWVLSTTMEKQLARVYAGFLLNLMTKREKRSLDGRWQWEGAESILKAVGNQDVRMYIDRRQATVAQWVALRPIFEV